jgi:alpha-amylase
MLNIVLYLQVHQPFRLKKLSIFDIKDMVDPFDEELNRSVIERVSEKCYIPACKLLIYLINKYRGKFKLALSISGTAYEQLEAWRPDALYLFKELAQTGGVELLGETYYHSLSYIFDQQEFTEQVEMHIELLQNKMGVTPAVFRNTELVYENKISRYIDRFKNFKVILTEGADWLLRQSSPFVPYRTYNGLHFLLFKYYPFSDDIAFRFSDKNWGDCPLTAGKFVSNIHRMNSRKTEEKRLYLNLFLDFETFGEHQWKESGIFVFLDELPAEVLKQGDLSFCWPSEVIQHEGCLPATFSVESPVSWADSPRDLSAWLGNDMQRNAYEALFEILRDIKKGGGHKLLETARKLSTSDHLYYMSRRNSPDGDVHRYFSPFDTPEKAYLHFLYALSGLEERVRYI